MKIVEKKIEKKHTDTQYETTTLYWKIIFDTNELEPKLFEKFYITELEQRYVYGKDLYTYFKGGRTNWFYTNTQDKLKKKMIEIVKDVMRKQDIEVDSMWNTKIEYQ
jgi:hypothetical protein